MVSGCRSALALQDGGPATTQGMPFARVSPPTRTLSIVVLAAVGGARSKGDGTRSRGRVKLVGWALYGATSRPSKAWCEDGALHGPGGRRPCQSTRSGLGRRLRDVFTSAGRANTVGSLRGPPLRKRVRSGVSAERRDGAVGPRHQVALCATVLGLAPAQSEAAVSAQGRPPAEGGPSRGAVTGGLKSVTAVRGSKVFAVRC